MASTSLPSRVIVAVGTYDGVLAGWELETNKLKLSFATPVHGGSVRSLAVSSKHDDSSPGSLLSCGYDEVLKTHDLHKRLTSSGEVRIPADMQFGTPIVSSFAAGTHCLVGFSGGKLVLYQTRDWTIQHVLAGHEGGIASLAVHPTGTLALTGGTHDGKLKLWDLTKGRLAFCTKLPPASSRVAGRTHYDAIDSLVWNTEGTAYGFCYGSHVTVRDVATGGDLLDVELPSRVNQMCLMQGEQGLFVAAACNDGSLPVLAVDSDESQEERRAIMAIEPVDGPVAGRERFKCIQAIAGYHVATANSAGVVSVYNLQGAVNMIQNDESEGADEETPVHPSSDDDEDDSESDDKEDDSVELAVDIIDSVQLGTGARITCLVAWSSPIVDTTKEAVDEPPNEEQEETAVDRPDDDESSAPDKKRKLNNGRQQQVTLDSEALERARALVADAKKIQKRKERRKSKKHKKKHGVLN